MTRTCLVVLALCSGCELVRAPDGSYACGSQADCTSAEICTAGFCVPRAGDGGRANYAFATSRRFNGNLGGLAGADGICQRFADDAGLQGSYRAWLSVTGADGGAAARLAGARGWIRPDGKPFADTIGALVGSKQVFYPLVLSEDGGTAATSTWTGTLDDGTPSGGSCDDWTTSDAGTVGGQGRPSRTRLWSITGVGPCNVTGGLFCFGVDRSLPVAPRAVGTARRAFLSAPYLVGGGLAAFDRACQDEAADAGFGRGFRALVAPAPGLTAASRFSADGGTWVRVDGAALASTAAELLTGTPDTTLNVSATGVYGSPSTLVWTGATAISAAADGGTCEMWMNAAAAGRPGVGDADDLAAWFVAGPMSTCNQPGRLYCLEE